MVCFDCCRRSLQFRGGDGDGAQQRDIYIYISVLPMASFGHVQLPSPAPPFPSIGTDHSRSSMHASARYLCSHFGMQDVSSRYKLWVLLLYTCCPTLARRQRHIVRCSFLDGEKMLFCCRCWDDNGILGGR